MVGRIIPNAPRQTHRAFINVASTLHVVPAKYDQYFRIERHVSGGAPIQGAYSLSLCILFGPLVGLCRNA